MSLIDLVRKANENSNSLDINISDDKEIPTELKVDEKKIEERQFQNFDDYLLWELKGAGRVIKNFGWDIKDVGKASAGFISSAAKRGARGLGRTIIWTKGELSHWLPSRQAKQLEKSILGSESEFSLEEISDAMPLFWHMIEARQYRDQWLLTDEWLDRYSDVYNDLPEIYQWLIDNSNSIEQLQNSIYSASFRWLDKETQDRMFEDYNKALDNINRIRKEQDNFHKIEGVSLSKVLMEDEWFMKWNDFRVSYADKLEEIDSLSKDRNKDIAQSIGQLLWDMQKDTVGLYQNLFEEGWFENEKVKKTFKNYENLTKNLADTIFIKANKYIEENPTWNFEEFLDDFLEKDDWFKSLFRSWRLAGNEVRRTSIQEWWLKWWLEQFFEWKLITGWYKALTWLFWTAAWEVKSLWIETWGTIPFYDPWDLDYMKMYSNQISTTKRLGRWLRYFLEEYSTDIAQLVAVWVATKWIWLVSKLGWGWKVAKAAGFLNNVLNSKAGRVWRYLHVNAGIDAIFDYYSNPYLTDKSVHLNILMNGLVDWIPPIARKFLKAKDLKKIETALTKSFKMWDDVVWKVNLLDIVQWYTWDWLIHKIINFAWDNKQLLWKKFLNTVDDIVKNFDGLTLKQKKLASEKLILDLETSFRWLPIEDAKSAEVVFNKIQDWKRWIQSGSWKAQKEIIWEVSNTLKRWVDNLSHKVSSSVEAVGKEIKATWWIGSDTLNSATQWIKNFEQWIIKEFADQILKIEKFQWSSKIKKIVDKIKETWKITDRNVVDVIDAIGATKGKKNFDGYLKMLQDFLWTLPKWIDNYNNYLKFYDNLSKVNKTFWKRIKDIDFSVAWKKAFKDSSVWMFDPQKGTIKLLALRWSYENLDQFVAVAIHEIWHALWDYLKKNIDVNLFKKAKKEFLDTVTKVLGEKKRISLRDLDKVSVQKKLWIDINPDFYNWIKQEAQKYSSFDEFVAYNFEAWLTKALNLKTPEWKFWTAVAESVSEILKWIDPNITDAQINNIAWKLFNTKYSNSIPTDKIFNRTMAKSMANTNEVVKSYNNIYSKSLEPVYEWQSVRTFVNNLKEKFVEVNKSNVDELKNYIKEINGDLYKVIDDTWLFKIIDETDDAILKNYIIESIWDMLILWTKDEWWMVSWLMYSFFTKYGVSKEITNKEALKSYLWIIQNNLENFLTKTQKWTLRDENIWIAQWFFNTLIDSVWKSRWWTVWNVIRDFTKNLQSSFLRSGQKGWFADYLKKLFTRTEKKETLASIAQVLRMFEAPQLRAVKRMWGINAWVNISRWFWLPVKWDWRLIQKVFDSLWYNRFDKWVRDYPLIKMLSIENQIQLVGWEASYKKLQDYLFQIVNKNWKKITKNNIIDELLKFWKDNKLIKITKEPWELFLLWKNISHKLKDDDSIRIFMDFAHSNFTKDIADDILEKIYFMKKIPNEKLSNYRKLSDRIAKNIDTRLASIKSKIPNVDIQKTNVWVDRIARENVDLISYKRNKTITNLYEFRWVDWNKYLVTDSWNLFVFNWQNTAQTLADINYLTTTNKSKWVFNEMYNTMISKHKDIWEFNKFMENLKQSLSACIKK